MGFDLKDQFKFQIADAPINQAQNSLMNSSLYQRESQGSFDATKRKTQHYLSKRLQCKIVEINQRRRLIGSNDFSITQRDDSAPGSVLRHIGPRLTSGLSSQSRLPLSAYEPKPTPEYSVPIIAPDPDLAKQMQQSNNNGSKTAT